MAFLNVNTPLKNLKTGDYFYPLTNLDQIITGNNRLSAFFTENNNKLDLSNIGNIVANNLTVNNITVGKIHSNATATDNDITRIPSNNEIALETGNGNGSISSWIWREQYSSSNWGIFHNNSTNILQFVGNNLQQVAINLGSGRLYCNEWIEFSGNKGLFFPNSGSGTYLYPANDCTYGSFQMNGTKGGYYGITSGPNNNFLTFMSQNQHQGLYNAANSQWAFYYDKTNKRVGILASVTDANYPICLNGATYIAGKAHVAAQLNIAGGMNWPAPQNITCSYTANNQECSFDMNSGSHTGCYWQVWSVKNDASCLQCFNDDRHSWAFKLYGAVWNDYAEFRETKQEIEPGRCIVETGKGDLILSTKRLQEGCEIVSDTFGFAIGQSKQCNTPTAASGRVLAYPYEDKYLFKPGKPVCSGPNGTISIMTDEEAKLYPWCIIGTVSEIPNYEEWQCGDEKTTPLKVNGRIWIRIR